MLTRNNFLSITSLACISGSTSIVLFSQEKPLRWMEIHIHTAAAVNHTSEREILSRTCYFGNSQWITSEENCSDKIYFRLNSKAGGRDLPGYVYSQCQTKLYLSIIHKEFNCLDKSYIFMKK